MSTLIIIEPYLGNTLQIAHAITDVLPGAELQSFDEAPDTIPDDIDLLLLGAPAHETVLPSSKSRHSATTRNSVGSANRVQLPPQRGLTEWAKHATIPAGTQIITFDTSVGRFATVFDCTARAAARQLCTRGFRVERGPSFTVTAGDVLVTSQQEQAAQWAASLLSKNQQNETVKGGHCYGPWPRPDPMDLRELIHTSYSWHLGCYRFRGRQ